MSLSQCERRKDKAKKTNRSDSRPDDFGRLILEVRKESKRAGRGRVASSVVDIITDQMDVQPKKSGTSD